jgi:hypothetical protein
LAKARYYILQAHDLKVVATLFLSAVTHIDAFMDQWIER